MNITNIFAQDAASRVWYPGDVLNQLHVTLTHSVGIMILFVALRQKNKGSLLGCCQLHISIEDHAFYEPKIKYCDKQPSWTSSGLLGWIPPLIQTKEPELIDKIGLDVAAFLRFIRMMRTIFSLVALLTCVVLIPINVTYNLSHVPSSDRDILSMLTIRDVRGNYLWAHVSMVYIITAVVIVIVWFHWSAMVGLRTQFFLSSEHALYSDAVLTVMHVPKELQSDQGIKTLLDSVQVPYPFTSVNIGRSVGKLPHLIKSHNDTVQNFERVLVQYLKGGKIGKKRPTIRLGGFLGMGGEVKDAIDYYTQKLRQTEEAVKNYRDQIDTHMPENYGFACMSSVPYAHVVAQMLKNERPKGAKIILTPKPEDIIWENLNMSPAKLIIRKTIGWALLTILIILSLPPLFGISFLANTFYFSSLIPFLDYWAQHSPWTFNYIPGLLIPIAYKLFDNFFMSMVFGLSRYQGSATGSRLQSAILARCFSFYVISELIIFTLIGATFNSVAEIIKEIEYDKGLRDVLNNIEKLPAKINQTYINQSSYWFTYFLFCTCIDTFGFVGVTELVWEWFKKLILRRTRLPREVMQPPKHDLSSRYAYILFLGTVGLVFAPLAPLLPVGAVLILWINSWVLKYKSMFYFVPSVENGGRLWNPVINRLLVSLSLMQALMSLTIGLQLGWKSFAWAASIPPFITVILFKVYINRVFARPFRYYVPTEAESRGAQVHSTRGDIEENRLEKRFGHPALHAELFTPVLYADMMPLLAQVYSGRMDTDQTNLGEYGDEQTDAHLLPGGIRIAGIDQSDPEYDPVLNQRDRGELDWDQRSILTALDSTSGFPADGRNSPAPSRDQQPLLHSTLAPGSGQSSRNSSGYSSPQPQYTALGTTQYLPLPDTA